jgi:hypothetical protein
MSKNKQEDWKMIKEQAPALANFLVEFNKAFGKPEAMRVELVGGLVVNVGDFAKGVIDGKR